LLRLGKIDEAQALFSYLQYAPALVDLCRIAVYRNDQATAHKLFQVLHRSDPEHKSLEIYQLNSLGQRHFGNRFAEINPTRDRSLIYSRNMPLEYQKHVSSMIFDFTPGEIYAPYISGLPYVESPAFKPTDEMLFAASTNKQSVSRGEQLFHGQNCSVCHGQAGIGITGPNLRDDFWIIQATPTQIFFTLQDGRANNTMPGYKHLLDSEQLTDLSAYLIHLNRSAVKDGSGKAPQGQPQRLIPVNQ
jgi:mono/diheme cytochrome c family protein